MLGAAEQEMIVYLVIGIAGGVTVSSLIWWICTRERHALYSAESITRPVIKDRSYQIETNGEADLEKLAAQQQGVAFDGAGDPGEPQPYKVKDIPF